MCSMVFVWGCSWVSCGGVEWAQESEVGIMYRSNVVVSISAILGGEGVRMSEAR